MADDVGEKSEQPTGKRKSDARTRGKVPKSKDLSSAVMLAAGLIIFRILGHRMFEDMGILMQRELGGDTIGSTLSTDGLIGQVATTVAFAARIALAPMLLIFAAAIVSSFMQVGWLFTLKPIQPDFSKMNPVGGFKQIFGKRGLAKSVADVGKFSCVAAVIILVVAGDLRAIAILPQLDALPAFLLVTSKLFDLAIKVAIVLLLLGIADWVYQKWQHTQDLKMTKTEVKEERKAADGDPKIKHKRFQMAQQIHMQRLGIDVPRADVVVTNPTHFSVALKYDAQKMNAPKVIAKGADVMAFRIRQIAVAHSVPIVERAPLARALYRHVEVGQEVPPAQYQAVAEVLAYVYRLEGKAAG
ncbi:MAG: flagellar biosynthesis protein FlhB [Phycisphaerales bacterium]|nr:flagellar biosynthesis protein FlhB [Phycisphaerales bacterium]